VIWPLYAAALILLHLLLRRLPWEMVNKRNSNERFLPTATSPSPRLSSCCCFWPQSSYAPLRSWLWPAVPCCWRAVWFTLWPCLDAGKSLAITWLEWRSHSRAWLWAMMLIILQAVR